MPKSTNPQLSRTLGPIMLWGLGVGYVISGNYFGWNLGLARGGTWGMLLALIPVIVMYVFFTFCYTEMACAIPKAGGAFDYGTQAFGKTYGLICGTAQLAEFVFAPPAIALGLGAYLNGFFPEIPALFTAVVAYVLFTGINIAGVKTAASLELVVTAVAVLGLLIFAGNALPSFNTENLKIGELPFGWAGVAAAIPFAIWFFLAIEGVANVAEETINPQKNILRGFGAALVTLVILCFLTFFSATGANGWESAVYPTGSEAESDSPLPLVMASLGAGSVWQNGMLVFGLFGIVASLNGIILAAGRALYEMAKSGFAPPLLSMLHKRFKSPHGALIANLLVGIGALFTGRTGDLITIACFGALTLYTLSMLAYLKLRWANPEMDRPFRAPFYPVAPVISAVIAIGCFIAMAWFSPWHAALFLLFLASFSIITILFRKQIHHEKL